MPFYSPAPHEDPAAWEAALRAKPGPGFMPALILGFPGLAERLKAQRRAVAEYNTRMHEASRSLDAVLAHHELDTSVRAVAARRRHAALKQRTLRLAARVQVLRNRGYALAPEEDAVRARLVALERRVEDPRLGARADELWSRLMGVREYAAAVRDEVARRDAAKAGISGGAPAAAQQEEVPLDEDAERRLKEVGWILLL